MAFAKRAHARVPSRASSYVVTQNAIDEAATLPPVNPIVVDALIEMIMTDQQDVRRPPEKSAALLALSVELYKTNRPFPTRMAAALHLECSIFTVDAAISTRINEGYLTQVVETEEGNVSARGSIVRKRYYIPSKDVIDVAERAVRKLRNKK